MVQFIQKLGLGLAVLGAAALVGIFGIVVVLGSWPDFLEPVQTRFRLLNGFVGGLSFAIEVMVFVGPGLLVMLLGSSWEQRASARKGRSSISNRDTTLR